MNEFATCLFPLTNSEPRTPLTAERSDKEDNGLATQLDKKSTNLGQQDRPLAQMAPHQPSYMIYYLCRATRSEKIILRIDSLNFVILRMRITIR